MSKAPILSADNLLDNAVAIAISIVLHIILAVVAFQNLESPVKEVDDLEGAIDVSFEKPANTARTAVQMVSPSDATVDKPPPVTNKLSDKDSVVEKEQIRRGDPGIAAPDRGTANDRIKAPAQERTVPRETEAKPEKREKPREEKPAQKAPAKAEVQKPQNAPQKLSNLRLDPATVLSKFGEVEARVDRKPEDLTSRISGGSAVGSTSNYKAFSRPSGSGAAFLGTGGVRDFLPGLPDGDITLLNAKASTYASFVRRVATQVFALMRQTGWDELHYGDIRQINDFNTVVAVLSKDGKFLRAELKDGSGSSRFDVVLVQAAQRGAKDPNPPAGAVASDGTIRFIFKSRSWADGASDPRSGAPMERRWLMLATGLE